MITTTLSDTKLERKLVCFAEYLCAGVVLDYLHRDRPGAGLAETLFVTLQMGHPYGKQDLRKLVRVVAKRAGITKRVWPHLFRNSLATNMQIRSAHILVNNEQPGP